MHEVTEDRTTLLRVDVEFTVFRIQIPRADTHSLWALSVVAGGVGVEPPANVSHTTAGILPIHSFNDN